MNAAIRKTHHMKSRLDTSRKIIAMTKTKCGCLGCGHKKIAKLANILSKSELRNRLELLNTRCTTDKACNLGFYQGYLAVYNLIDETAPEAVAAAALPLSCSVADFKSKEQHIAHQDGYIVGVLATAYSIANPY